MHDDGLDATHEDVRRVLIHRALAVAHLVRVRVSSRVRVRVGARVRVRVRVGLAVAHLRS